MTINPQSPRFEHGWGAMWGASGGSFPNDRFVPVTDRTQGATGTQRGRQYETDQVQAGTLNTVLSDNDGALDPTNTTGPWFGHIMPYQPYRLRAQWPATKNMLTPALAYCGGLPAGAADQGVSGSGMFGPSLSVVTSASAVSGTAVWQASVTAATAQNVMFFYNRVTALQPGRTYSMSVYARVVTDSVSPKIQAEFGWYGPVPNAATTGRVLGPTVTLTGSSTSTTWTRFTLTATVPDGCYGASVALSAAEIVPAGYTIQTSAWQLEEGAAATAYADPGPWSPMFSGFVERWPETWTQGYSYSVVQPTAVDAFALLSQRQLRDVLTEEIYSNNPRFLYALDDPQDASSAVDATGNHSPASINSSKYGKGSVTFGNSIAATDPVNGVFAGNGTVCSVANSNPGTDSYGPASFIDLTSAGIRGPLNPAGDWARMIAFRYTGPRPTSGSEASIWCCLDRNPVAFAGSRLEMFIDPAGKFLITISGPTGASSSFNPTSEIVDDGNWHLAILSYRGASRALTVNVDGVGTGVVITAAMIPTGLVSDSIGAEADPARGNAAAWNYQGDLAFAAEFSSFLEDQAIFDIQAAWRNAFSGDSTDQRYNRILTFSGYTGSRSVHAGQTTAMGPAQLDGQDALSALAEVVDTEGGMHFVSAGGAVCFRPRSDRYNVADPAVIFGEDEASGEIPYEDIQLDYDPTHLGNLAQVTQPSTGQVFTAEDDLSQQRYYPRTIQRTVNALSPLECQDAAAYLVSRYKDPATRVTSLTVNPSSNPALWSVCLGLELATRVRVIRRPLGRPPIVIDAFIENMTWSLTDTNTAQLMIQCSPADTTTYGSFAAWHGTLAAASSAGATTVTLGPSADTVNPIDCQMAPGQQLVLGLGTANQETVTVKTLPITSPGWTGAAITLTAATTKSHAAGVVVCEPLPAGVADPTTWDTVSEFDNHAFVY